MTTLSERVEGIRQYANELQDMVIKYDMAQAEQNELLGKIKKISFDLRSEIINVQCVVRRIKDGIDSQSKSISEII